MKDIFLEPGGSSLASRLRWRQRNDRVENGTVLVASRVDSGLRRNDEDANE